MYCVLIVSCSILISVMSLFGDVVVVLVTCVNG